MSRTGNWVLEMQEDAYHMTLQQFIDRHGFSSAEIWYSAHFGDDRNCDEPIYDEEYMEIDDGA